MSRPPQSRRKATLFCADCGHESPLDGDWQFSGSAESYRVRCPECRATVVDHRHDRAVAVPDAASAYRRQRSFAETVTSTWTAFYRTCSKSVASWTPSASTWMG